MSRPESAQHPRLSEPFPPALPRLEIAERFPTREVSIGSLRIGAHHPILVQSMTISDTRSTEAVVREVRELVDAGCPLVRLTAPSQLDAENLREIRKRLAADGVRVPMVADIHFTPNAALVAADIVEKVRINPGNYSDRKKFKVFEISDADYAIELERIREVFLPLVHKLKANGAALRIGTNHGSLSDRIMNRYGDTPEGMVESALEFVRICADEGYHNLVLSMKSSIPSVMIAAYRLLVRRMTDEHMDYPIHLGVTEAGNGLEGRMKSTIGIGSLLATGIGDTIRVSLTEDSRHEIAAARNILEAVALEARCPDPALERSAVRRPLWRDLPASSHVPRRRTGAWALAGTRLGGGAPPAVELRLGAGFWSRDPAGSVRLVPHEEEGARADLLSVRAPWGEAAPAPSAIETVVSALRGRAAWLGERPLLLEWPGVVPDPATLAPVVGLVDAIGLTWPATGLDARTRASIEALAEWGKPVRWRLPIALHPERVHDLVDLATRDRRVLAGFVCEPGPWLLPRARALARMIESAGSLFFLEGPPDGASAPLWVGSLILDGIGDVVCLSSTDRFGGAEVSARAWPAGGVAWTINPVAGAFQLLQACRVRLTRAEFIACPSCGRTQFDLQETTARIRKRTEHLRGVKIAIMGCIVNGPGEMADADFGYVGSGRGKVDLYVGKERVERGVAEEEAEERLVSLLRERGRWVEPSPRA